MRAGRDTAGDQLLQEVEDRESKLLYFVAIDDARFRRPVVPGDQLRIEVNVLSWRGNFCKLAGTETLGPDCNVELITATFYAYAPNANP